MIYFRSKSWELNFPGPQLLRVKSTENLRSDILIIPLPDASLGNHSSPKKTNQQILLKNINNENNWGWRDGSAFKYTSYSSKGPEFGFQHPHQVAH